MDVLLRVPQVSTLASVSIELDMFANLEVTQQLRDWLLTRPVEGHPLTITLLGELWSHEPNEVYRASEAPLLHDIRNRCTLKDLRVFKVTPDGSSTSWTDKDESVEDVEYCQ